MFIIIFIYSKNLNSLTNFLKLFYKLKKNQAMKIKFQSIQAQRKKKFSFFSTLQSPHVNKTSQEQFEYNIHSKKLKIRVPQITKFLVLWKTIEMTLFPDIQIKTQFRIQNRVKRSILLSKIDYDKFSAPKFFKSQVKWSRKINFFSSQKKIEKKLICVSRPHSRLSNAIIHTSLSLLDIRGEILLKSLSICLDSSVGRAKDWKSLCRQFKPVSKHSKTLLWKILYEIYQLIWEIVRFLTEILSTNQKRQ